MVTVKNNIGLVEYAKSQLGNPYWYGTYGQTANSSLYTAKKKQYPKYYTATDFTQQYGKRVHDCVGLVKGYLWSENETTAPKYNAEQDVSANGMRKKCTVSGKIALMPETVGLLLFFDGHVGVYIGNGEVIEARGHAYGVVKTKLKDRPWIWWGKCPFIIYEEETNKILEWQNAAIADGYKLAGGADGIWGEECEAVAKKAVCKKPLIKGRYKNKNLTAFYQRLLGFAGKDIDGKFWTATEKAVKARQKALGFTGKEVDGKIGINTHKAFLGV